MNLSLSVRHQEVRRAIGEGMIKIGEVYNWSRKYIIELINEA